MISARSLAKHYGQTDQVSAPVGFLVTVLYCTVVLGVGAALIARRDA